MVNLYGILCRKKFFMAVLIIHFSNKGNNPDSGKMFHRVFYWFSSLFKLRLIRIPGELYKNCDLMRCVLYRLA